MTKQEFLSGLELALKRKGVGDIPEIIADYNEHFDAGAASGKSEQQIIIELGAIDSIAGEYESKSSPYTQSFGNITNFYNGSGGGSAGGGNNGGAEPKVKPSVKREEPNEQPKYRKYEEDRGGAKTTKESDYGANEKPRGKSIVGVLLSIVFGFAYVIGGIAIISTTIGLAIAGISSAVALVVSGMVFSAASWFIFGSFLIKLSGFFAGLAIIALGVVIGKAFMLAVRIIKLVFNYAVNIFKKGLKGVN